MLFSRAGILNYSSEKKKNALRNAHNAIILSTIITSFFPLTQQQQQQPSSATQQTHSQTPTSFFHTQLP